MSKPPANQLPWSVHKPRTKRSKLPWAKSEPFAPPPPSTAKTEQAHQAKIAQGQAAEQAAMEHLEQHGLTMLTRNYRCRVGEIDLIMKQGTTAVIVEVRQRSTHTHGTALDSITHGKQQRVTRCAKHWWMRIGQHQFEHLRFDVVTLQEDHAPLWIQNAWQISAP